MKNRTGNRGFTLVELLTVIVIIALLLTILVPTIAGIARGSYATKTKTRIGALQTGIALYWEDTGKRFYPGQQYLKDLAGGDETGAKNTTTWTGSQWLARCLFTQKGGTFPGNFKGDPGYVGYTSDMLVKDSGTAPTDAYNMAISDHFPDPLPICYYVARPRLQGFDQFKLADNQTYTDAYISGESASFIDTTTPANSFISDKRFGGANPYHGDAYLLIAPGIDRKYFTTDDLTNF